MGLLSMAWAYRKGRRAEQRRRRAEDAALEDELDELTDVCTNCGSLRMQHDAAGRCPRYD
ncbi:MAG: 50S ribosomal protein L32 [Ilumatobacteraceae bacterium]